MKTEEEIKELLQGLQVNLDLAVENKQYGFASRIVTRIKLLKWILEEAQK